MRFYQQRNLFGQLRSSWPLWLLFVCIGVVYFNSLLVPFQFDDSSHFRRYQEIAAQPLLEWPAALRAFSRPLSIATFVAQFRLTGAAVVPLHIVNIAVHLIVSCMVFFLSRRLIQQLLPQAASQRQQTLLAAAIALIFAVHPVQTQAVTYLIQRMTALGALWYITSLYLLVRALQSSHCSKSRHWWFGGALVTGFAAFLSKENTYTLPLMWILVWWFVGRLARVQFSMGWLAAGAAGVLVTCSALWLNQITIRTFITQSTLSPAKQQFSAVSYGYTQLSLYPRYLGTLVLPIRQSIDHMPAPTTTVDTSVLVGILVILSLLAFATYAYRRAPLITFGLLWYMITMVVESSVVPISDVFVEHRLYLPSIGMIMAVVAAMFLVAQRVQKEKIFYVLVGLLVVLGSIGTIRRNYVWRTELTLWRDAMEKSPNNPRAQYNYAMEAIRQGNPQNAIVSLNAALDILPKFAVAHNNLGVLLFFIGEYPLARYHFLEALRYDIKNPTYEKNVIRMVEIAEGASASAEPEYIMEMFN